MAIKIAINGYGRIGRSILRAVFEREQSDPIEIVAINDLGDLAVHAHLTQYDTTHGRFQYAVHVENNQLRIHNQVIQALCEPDPSKLPWQDLGVDVVLECTGRFANPEKASAHLKAGAKKVLISAPAGRDVDATIVYGVNHTQLKASDRIVSNASCTTNCLAPVAQVLHEAVGIEKGLMTTIHAYTNDQVLTDVYHADLYRARCATQSMIPTKTGAAVALGWVLPELQGKLDGLAMRVPLINVSIVDLSFSAKRSTSVLEINEAMVKAANGALKGVLAVNDQPLVSCDFNHHPASSIFDLTQTKVIDDFVKVFAWYDNEWGFANRMLDTTVAWMHV